MLSLVGCILFIAVIPALVAPECVCIEQSNFTSTPQIFSTCIPFLQGPVLVDTSQQGVNSTVSSAVRALQLAPHNCASKAIELECQTAYPECYSTNPSRPSLPCKDKCSATMQICNPFLYQTQNLLHIPDLFPSTCDRWPSNFTVYYNAGEEQLVPCNSHTSGNNISTRPDSCPYIMHWAENPSNSEAPCQVKCPLPLFHDGVWERDMRVAYTLAWMSFICLIFMISSFLLNENKRKYPQNLFINLFVCCLILSIFIMMGTMAGRHKVLCHDGNPSTQEFAPCGVQGSLIFYFALAATCWWFSIVVNLYIMVRATVQTFSHENAKYFYVFSYGFPAVMLILALCLKAFGFYAPNVICFLPYEGSKEWVQYVVYYLPVGLMIVAGATLNGIIFRKLIQAYYNNIGKIDKRSLSPYYKIAVFTGCFLFIWIAIFVRMGVANSRPVHDSFVKFALCHILQYAQNDDSASNCGSVPEVQPKLSIVRLQYVAMTVHGIVCFFLFCHDREVYSGWRNLYKKVRGKVEERKREVRGRGGGVEMALRDTTNGSGGTTAVIIS